MTTSGNSVSAEKGRQPPVAKAGAPRLRPMRKNGWTAFWFLLPAVGALLAIGLYPLLFAVYNSFRRYHLARPNEARDFVGFDNYVNALTDPSFIEALVRTLWFLATVLPIQIALGLGIALLLHRPGFGFVKIFTRLSLVIPLATTYAVVGLMGRLLFNRESGVVNWFIGVFGFAPVEWLGSTTNAFIAVAIMDIWQWTPFCALILLAGLTMVPGEIEEAARLETKSWWRILVHVQLPYLLPGLTAVLILRTAEVLKLFDLIFTMTRGGPGAATELISIYIQRIGFRVFDQGMASAQAILLLILTIILSRLYIRIVYREVSA